MTPGGHYFLLHRTAASELVPILEVPLGLSLPALSRASGVCLGAQRHRGEALRFTSSPSTVVSQVLLRSSTQPVTFWRHLPSQALTCFSLTIRKLEVVATPTFLRSLWQCFSEAADAPRHRCPWANISRVQVLARESNGAFFHPRQLRPRCNMVAK